MINKNYLSHITYAVCLSTDPVFFFFPDAGCCSVRWGRSVYFKPSIYDFVWSRDQKTAGKTTFFYNLCIGKRKHIGLVTFCCFTKCNLDLAGLGLSLEHYSPARCSGRGPRRGGGSLRTSVCSDVKATARRECEKEVG